MGQLILSQRLELTEAGHVAGQYRLELRGLVHCLTACHKSVGFHTIWEIPENNAPNRSDLPEWAPRPARPTADWAAWDHPL